MFETRKYHMDSLKEQSCSDKKVKPVKDLHPNDVDTIKEEDLEEIVKLQKGNVVIRNVNSALKRLKTPALVISKLFDLLEDNESKNIVTWSNDGKSISVLDESMFSEQVLLKYYNHNNFEYFCHILNLYGFKKVEMIGRENKKFQVISHPRFKRDNRRELHTIRLAAKNDEMSTKNCSDKKVKPVKDLHPNDVNTIEEEDISSNERIVKLQNDVIALKKINATLKDEKTALKAELDLVKGENKLLGEFFNDLSNSGNAPEETSNIFDAAEIQADSHAAETDEEKEKEWELLCSFADFIRKNTEEEEEEDQ